MRSSVIVFLSMLVAITAVTKVARAEAARLEPQRSDTCLHALEENGTLRHAGLDAKSDTIQGVENDIADLILEKAELAKSGDSALLSLVEKNIKAKIAEYESRSGQRIDENEIKNLVHLRETSRHQGTVENQEREDSARERERQSGVGWTLAPVSLRKNFLAEPYKYRMTDIMLDTAESHGPRVIFNASHFEKGRLGYHMHDLGSGQDHDFGEKAGSVVPYGPSEDGVYVVVSAIITLVDPVTLSIVNTKTGQSKSFELKTGWPLSRKIRGGVDAFPYRRADGTMGIIIKKKLFPESIYSLKSRLFYDFDPRTGKTRSLGALEPFSHMVRSPDGQHLYSVGLSPADDMLPGSVVAKIVVRDFTASRVIYDETIALDCTRSPHDRVSDSSMSSIVSADGHVHLALNAHGTTKIMTRDLMTGEAQEFERKEFAHEGGVFIEGSHNELYFLPAPEETGGLQRIINLSSGDIEEKQLGEFAELKLVKTVGGRKVEPIAFYTALIKGTRDRVLISLPLSRGSLGASTVRLSDFHASELGDVAVTSDGRVVAAFINDSRSHSLNMHFVQLFGPAGATK